MFNPLHSISNQELFEKHLYNPRTPKEIVPHAPTILMIVRKVKYPLRFTVGYVHSSTNQELFEKHLCNQNSHYEK